MQSGYIVICKSSDLDVVSDQVRKCSCTQAVPGRKVKQELVASGTKFRDRLIRVWEP